MTPEEHRLFQAATEAYSKRDYESAVYGFAQVFCNGGDEPAVLRGYGRALLAAGFLRQASQVIETLVRVVPNDPEAHQLASQVFRARAMLPEAKKHLILARKLAPRDSSNLMALSYLAADEDDFDSAYEYLNLAANLNADPAIIAIAQANFSNRTGDIESAAVSYRRALELSDSHPGAIYGYACILLDLKRFDEAREWFGKVQPDDEPYADALYGEGCAAYWQGDAEAAIQAWRKALDVRPSFKQARNELYRLLGKLRRWPEAFAVARDYYARRDRD